MKNLIKRLLIILGSILFVLICFLVVSFVYLYKTADFKTPDVQLNLDSYSLDVDTDSLKVIDGNYLHLNEYGIWECYVSGTPLERGAKLGIMAKELLHYQESVFVDQIRQFVPSDSYFSFLHKLTAIFNRNMANYIPEEYREEIYGVSMSCSHEFDAFGTPYERQLNYHAAHDIGHAMQEYMLVGCSSFAVWNKMSRNSSLIVGRNFDFYVGDDFAKNKILLFVRPDEGYNFVSLAWPGMIGVVSGMNTEGLTVTINAAKGEIPTQSAMPISILARTILQYADDIETAYEIAKLHKTFVSESLLISSAKDNYAAIIEKTPRQTCLYEDYTETIICTNHFQSSCYVSDEYNVKNIRETDSKYRWNRLKELIREPLTPEKAVDCLRDNLGINNEDIGLTNPLSINQSIAHHSVVFQPQELRVWISTSYWQNGEFVCYDLNEVFSNNDTVNLTNYNKKMNIAADSVFINNQYPKIKEYKKNYKIIKQKIASSDKLPDGFISDFIRINPNYYETYNIAGDYMEKIGNNSMAVDYWKIALEKRVPTLSERNKILKKIENYD